MASNTKEMTLKKFKTFARRALRMERERTELENQLLSAAQPNKVQRDPIPDTKCILPQEPIPILPLTPKRPYIKPHLLLRPSSQPPIGRKSMIAPRPASLSGDIKFNHQSYDNELPRRMLNINKSQTMPTQSRRSTDSQTDSRQSLGDNVYNVNMNESEHVLHRRQVKKLHERAHRHVRAATAAAAAAAATVVAQLRKDAIDAVARQQAPYMRMAALSSARSNVGSGNTSYARGTQSEQRRVIRNSNLLSSALSIIREMDPAFLETLCYAIHDQVTKDDSSDSE